MLARSTFRCSGPAVTTLFLFGTLSIVLAAEVAAHAADQPAPATVAEAAKIIDLRKTKLPDGTPPAGQPSLAQLNYQTPGKVPALFDFHKQQLLAEKWAEQPQGYSSDQASSGSFKRDGFTLSLTVSSSGAEGQALVSLTNHGNVDVQKLPVPDGAKLLYGGPVSVMYVTETAVEQTAAELKKLLLKLGWTPYGTAGDLAYFKQNAVRVGANVSTAPAQQGKTVITFYSEQLSADLPAPETFEGLQYADTPTQLFFDTTLSEAALVHFYRDKFAAAGWKATTENPIKIDFRNEMIFRNPAEDLLTLETSTVEGKLRCLLRLQTAAEVAELERLAKAEIEARKKQREAQANSAAKVSLNLPSGADEVEQEKTSLSFKLGIGKAKGAVEGMRKTLRDAGWKEDESTLEGMYGTVSLSKEEQQILIVYVDPGIIPAEVTVSVNGAELEVPGGKKN